MKKWLSVILVWLIVLLSACQATPEREPVPNKGDRRMEEAINTTPVPTEGGFIVPHLDVPEHWTEDFSVDVWDFHIDADVLYTDVAHPVYIVENMTRFDGEKVKALMDLYMDVDRWLPLEASREDLMKRLEEVMRGVWNGETDPETGEDVYVSYPGQAEEIAEIIAKLNALDPSVAWEEISTVEDIPIGRGYISDGKRKAYYSQNGLKFYICESRELYHMNELAGLQSTFFDFGPNVPSGEVPEPSMTRERAIELANEVLKTTGLDETLSVSYSYKEQSVLNGEVTGVGWDVICMLKTSGVKMYDPLDYNFSAPPFSHIGFDGTADYRPSVYNQKLTLTFEDDILKGIYWDYPQRIVSVVNPAVEFMPFDEIMENIKNRMRYGTPTYAEFGLAPMKITVTEVALSYLKVNKTDDIYRYYWIPVWAVVSKTEGFAMSAPVAPGIFFVNAIDGTFIAFDFFQS